MALFTTTRSKREIKVDYPLLPCTHVLVPNDMLKVHAFDYQVETNDGRIRPAIGYKTEGFMGAFGQKEMVLILVVGDEEYDEVEVDDDDDGKVIPSIVSATATFLTTSVFGSPKRKKKKRKRRVFSYEDPLHFFKQLFRITSRGTVEHGSATKFVGDRGLFGASAILYVKMSSIAPISAAAAAASAVGGGRNHTENTHDLTYYSSYDEDCLALLLLYGEEERDALTTFGHLRVLGLLGHKQGYYPYPYWSDLRRPSLFQNCATLSSCSALGMFTGRIFLPPSSTLTHYPIQKKIVLKMTKRQTKRMLQQTNNDIWDNSNDNNNNNNDTNSNGTTTTNNTEQQAPFSVMNRELPRSENPTILLPGSIDENADGCYVRTIPEHNNKLPQQQQQLFRKKKKKNNSSSNNSNSKMNMFNYTTGSPSYDELLDDDDRINNNTLSYSSQQHQYYYYCHDDTMISRDKDMACCFLAIVGHSDKNIQTNHYRMMEDGFFVYVTEETWNGFWKQLMHHEFSSSEDHHDTPTNYQIQLTEGMVLSLEWLP